MLDILIIIFGCIFSFYLFIRLPYGMYRSRRKLKQLATEPPLRSLTLKEQQIIWLVYRHYAPDAPVYRIKGRVGMLFSTKPQSGMTNEYLIGPYRLTGRFIGEMTEWGEEVTAEVALHKGRIWLVSINGQALTDFYAAQWEAQFATPGPAPALNLAIERHREIEPDERQQLELPKKRSKDYFNLFLITFCAVNAYGMSREFGDVFMNCIIGLLALPVAGFLWRHFRARCPFGRPTNNRPDRSVTIARGTLVGCDGKQIWFTGDADQPPEDAAHRFTLPTLTPVDSLAPGQSVRIAFCAASQTLHNRITNNADEVCPQVLKIDGHFDAAQQFRDAPFAYWRPSIYPLAIGIFPLLGSLQSLFEEPALSSSIWLQLQLLLGLGWTGVGVFQLLSRQRKLRTQLEAVQ